MYTTNKLEKNVRDACLRCIPLLGINDNDDLKLLSLSIFCFCCLKCRVMSKADQICVSVFVVEL